MFALNFDTLKRKLEKQEGVEVKKLMTTWLGSPEFETYFATYNDLPHIQIATEDDNITYTFYLIKNKGKLVDLTKG